MILVLCHLLSPSPMVATSLIQSLKDVKFLPSGHPPIAAAPLLCQMKFPLHHPHVYLEENMQQVSGYDPSLSPVATNRLTKLHSSGSTASLSLTKIRDPVFPPAAPTRPHLGPWTDAGSSPGVFCRRPTHCICRMGLAEVCRLSTCSSQTWETA